MEAAGEGTAFDEEFDLEARDQYFVERPDDEFILTDGQNAHVSRPSQQRDASQAHHMPNHHYMLARPLASRGR